MIFSKKKTPNMTTHNMFTLLNTQGGKLALLTILLGLLSGPVVGRTLD